ncbi:hypothetical protein [Bradyrhizobium guangzhouense]|uniref:hypothetical protein n=1 Tax=Bradyrhizobium guangzhouense TaxID=1325095 RepID=UPI001009CFC7|nr:hypothetical protein [Bradyrhizobium guangzhouense]
MYKNSSGKYHRTDRDNPDPGEILDAAGVSPPGTPEFVRAVKFAVQKGGKATSNFSALAHYLNEQGIDNARGYPWTHDAINAFVKRYMPKGRTNSD